MISTPLGIGGEIIGTFAHACLFFEGYADVRRGAAGFIAPALVDRRQAVVLIETLDARPSLVEDLTAGANEAFHAADREGRVRRLTYTADADDCLELIDEAIDELSAGGIELTRVFGRPRWGAPDFPPDEDHLWLESRLNLAVARRKAVIICSYDTSSPPVASLVFGGLETHPTLILGERVVENASYLEPDRFFRERLLHLPWLGGRA